VIFAETGNFPLEKSHFEFPTMSGLADRQDYFTLAVLFRRCFIEEHFGFPGHY
jgi:hypothetical protein